MSGTGRALWCRCGGAVIIATGLLVASGRAQSRPEKQDLLWKKLEAEIARIDERFDGVMAVAIKDLTDGRVYGLHADEIMPTASMIKIAVLAELYRQRRLDEVYVVEVKDVVAGSDIMKGLTPGVTRLTFRDLATMMMAVSDNSATNVLIDRLGMDRVDQLLDGLGLRATRLKRKMMDLKAATEGRENVATPRETVGLLEAIYRGQVVSGADKDGLLEMLGTHKESDIARGLPEDVRIATKTGSLEGVRNEGGIVFATRRPFAIVVMTTFAADGSAAQRVISDVVRAAYPYFERVGRASEYGRVISPKN
ncbi:MAG: serine hydrolase [Gemmatimonadota bacterium]